jgi:hypothetical protein
MKFSVSILKKVAGVLIILLGILIFITPFTPGSWIIFVGLELLGIRMAVWERMKKLKAKSK